MTEKSVVFAFDQGTCTKEFIPVSTNYLADGVTVIGDPVDGVLMTANVNQDLCCEESAKSLSLRDACVANVLSTTLDTLEFMNDVCTETYTDVTNFETSTGTLIFASVDIVRPETVSGDVCC